MFTTTLLTQRQIIGLKAYLQLIRAPGLFSIIGNTLASFTIFFTLSESIRPEQAVSLFDYFPLLIVSLSLYQAGMILNDWADYDEDSIDRPFRPLPSGRIGKDQALYIAIGWIALALLIATAVSPNLLMLTGLLLAVILSYNLFSKGSVVGAINMGLVRALNWLLAASLFPLLDWRLYSASLVIFFYTTMITQLSQYELNSLSQQGLTTLRRLLLMLTIAVLTSFWLDQISVVGLLLLAMFIFYVRHIILNLNGSNAAEIQRSITQLLKLMVVLDGLLLCAFGHWVIGLICISLILLSGKLARFVYMT